GVGLRVTPGKRASPRLPGRSGLVVSRCPTPSEKAKRLLRRGGRGGGRAGAASPRKAPPVSPLREGGRGRCAWRLNACPKNPSLSPRGGGRRNWSLARQHPEQGRGIDLGRGGLAVRHGVGRIVAVARPVVAPGVEQGEVVAPALGRLL